MRLLLFIVALPLAGCGTLPGDIKKAIPNGSWESVTATVNGKFSSTQVEALGVVKDGDVLTAKELHVRHSNAWVPLIEYTAKGFVPAANAPSVLPRATDPR